MACSKCGNRIGFAFGMCAQCGYNDDFKRWDKIQVYVDDLPKYLKEYLIEKHASRYNK